MHDSLIQGGKTMDSKTYEINNLRILNDYLTQTIEVLARAQRIGLNRDVNREMGLTHTPFGHPGVFGVPVQGMGVDPRAMEFNGGLAHAPFGAYPYNYGMQPMQQAVPSFSGTPHTGNLPSNIDPFYAQRGGLSHTTGTPWTGWTPYTAAEIQRQRELSTMLARQQYEAMWRPFGV